MSNQLSQIKWLRVILTALVVYLVSFITVILIVTVYATYLAFQSRGAPDQAMINDFANQNAPWIGPLCLIPFIFLGVRHMSRRVDSAAIQVNGIAMGITIAILNLVVSGLSFSWGLLLMTILAIGAGWLSSIAVRKRALNQ